MGLVMFMPSQLTAWKQSNFEIYRSEAMGQQRSTRNIELLMDRAARSSNYS